VRLGRASYRVASPTVAATKPFVFLLGLPAFLLLLLFLTVLLSRGGRGRPLFFSFSPAGEDRGGDEKDD
jgi:hypothetical protein